MIALGATTFDLVLTMALPRPTLPSASTAVATGMPITSGTVMVVELSGDVMVDEVEVVEDEVVDEVEDDAPHPASIKVNATSETAIGSGWLNLGGFSTEPSLARVRTCRP